MQDKPYISIAIPTYEMKGRGAEFLDFSLEKISRQIFKDFEVVVSDDSKDNGIFKVCEKWSGSLRINYFKNPFPTGISSENLNNAIVNCKSDWIKILFQDDFLFDDDALSKTVALIGANPDCRWIASACAHTYDGKEIFNPMIPKWNSEMRLGKNTISSPSVITFCNYIPRILFDVSLQWMMDIDWYLKMHKKHGEPLYLPEVTVVNRIWNGSVSNQLNQGIKKGEEFMIAEKYE